MQNITQIRKTHIALAITSLICLPTEAATIEVDSLTDSIPNDGLCTLREAITSINDANVGDTGCLNSSDDDFGVSDSIQFADESPSIILSGTELSITADMTINAGDDVDNLTIDANNNSRVLNISNGASVTLNNSTITGGNATPGGGIIVTNNSELKLIESTVSNNSSNIRGGGIYSQQSTLYLEESSIERNQALHGAGIYLLESTSDIQNSTISRNSTNDNGIGGGVLARSSDVDVSNSTVSGNTAVFGGGIASYISGNVDITHTTVTLNSASYFAGIYFIPNQDNVITNSTITNSIVSGNKGNAGFGNQIFAYNNGPIGLFGNVLGDSSESILDAFYGVSIFPADGNIVASSNRPQSTPLAGILSPALALNGGPTRTHKLNPLGPAIDNANQIDCLVTDQRSVIRNPEACDIGSFEFVEGDEESETCFAIKIPDGGAVTFCL